MKKPNLKPNNFIKVLMVDEHRNSDVSCVVCWVSGEWRQKDNRWWKRGYYVFVQTGNGVAEHLNRHKTPLDWHKVIAWDYVDFSTLKNHFGAKRIKKMNRLDFYELTEQEIETLIESEIEFDESGNDGNGLNISDIMAKGSRREIYNYIYGG